MANQKNNPTDPRDADNDGKQSKDMPVNSKDDMQERLGLGLKNMYLGVLDEPLPDDMLALLDQLDDGDSDSDRPDSNE